jgi:bifunctional non-homologous end joining protein LigD
LNSETFAIIVFIEKLGAKPRRIASLYLRRYDGDRLLYAGKAQSGYAIPLARDLRRSRSPDRQGLGAHGPVSKPKATWVDPLLLAEIEFGGVTDNGLLRAPVFKGLRDDLAAPAPLKRKQQIVAVPRANIPELLPDAWCRR